LPDIRAVSNRAQSLVVEMIAPAAPSHAWSIPVTSTRSLWFGPMKP
jgi:hypothetical protein